MREEVVLPRLDPRPAPFPLLTLISKGLIVRGYVFSNFVADPANRRLLAEFVLESLRRGTLNPIIDRVFPLEDVAVANARLESGDQFGKIVITMPKLSSKAVAA